MSVVDSNLAKNFASRREFRREFPARSRRDFGRRKFASRWGSCRDSRQEYRQDFGCREAENLGKIPDSRRIPARFGRWEFRFPTRINPGSHRDSRWDAKILVLILQGHLLKITTKLQCFYMKDSLLSVLW